MKKIAELFNHNLNIDVLGTKMIFKALRCSISSTQNFFDKLKCYRNHVKDLYFYFSLFYAPCISRNYTRI